MKRDTADLVHPIFRRGLRILERLRRGEAAKLNMRNEQGGLRKEFKVTGPADAPAANQALGIRYPMACWLDERFIMDDDSPWQEEFRQESIEWALFRSVDRAWKFWEQAKLAETEGNADALEVFYLCVMLGFRGDYREDRNKLLDWRDNVAKIISRGWEVEWPDAPPALPIPEADVPPLSGKEKMRTLIVGFGITLGLLIFLTAFYLIFVQGS
jgi:type VI secretion system protein ImpK